MNADMIFNFPAQTRGHPHQRHRARGGKRRQPNHVLPAHGVASVARSLARTVGKVDYAREQRFYQIIDELLAGGDAPLFEHGSAWTFNRLSVPSACQPTERADAAASPSTPPRGDDGGARTEVRYASAIPTMRDTGETLADVGGPVKPRVR